MPDEPTFPGFVSPNYTQVPNEAFDVLLTAGVLTDSELRVLLYIIRRTFGFGKDADAISLSQFTDGITTRDGRRLDGGAGVGKAAAIRAVKGLVAKGCIVAARQASVTHGHEATVYRLRWAASSASDPRLSHTDTRVDSPVPQALDSPEYTQNESTKQREQEEELPPLAPHLLAAQAAYAARLHGR